MAKIEIDAADLAKLHEQMAELERKDVDRDSKVAGLEALIASTKGADVSGEGKIRERKTYEPKFRTIRIRKYPMKGKFDDLGYVVGWTNRGAYQEVDRTGVSPQVVDFIDVIFLGHEKNDKGVLQAEKIRLLDLLNSGQQVHCKIVKVEREDKKVPTGEEINVTTWDPQHGLVMTGDIIDGYTAYSDIQYTIEVPGIGQITIDGQFVN